PMLCTLQLNGLVDALREMNLDPQTDFTILSVSFDPLETSSLAASKKKTYMQQYARPGAAGAWRFLTGKSDAIRKLTDAVGFHYKWNEQAGEWAHKATLVICTPDGRISRYMGGVMFDPPTLRMSLIEASEGKIGNVFDAVFLSCFHYVSKDGRYTASVLGIMRLGGVLTVLIVGGVLLFFWRYDARRRRMAAVAACAASPASVDEGAERPAEGDRS
ncbi:MAG: SCO family protein, partial [Planctomycetota bacterium]